ncbi:uncharacterized protein LOC143463348 [Clavelina lepadiformis]|uniref:Uncharacterized protein n=1 Tax=Clavelina lepadiformis TaxID=159417 RepID=A0ABP0GMM4_CLALP
MNIKRIILLLVTITAGVCGKYSEAEKGRWDWANFAAEEIAKKTHSNLVLLDLLQYKETVAYNAVIAKEEHKLHMDLKIRHVKSGQFDHCSAVVTIPTLPMNDRWQDVKLSFECKQIGGKMFKKSATKPCTAEEEKELRGKVEGFVNKNIEEENELETSFDFPGMDMGSNLQSPFKLEKVLVCNSKQVQSGTQFTVQIEARQDDINQVCSAKVLKRLDGKFDLESNQCQGSNYND